MNTLPARFAALVFLSMCPLSLGAQTTSTRVNKDTHEVSLIVSPFDVPPMDHHAMMNHASMQMGHDEGVRTLYQFEWPVDGYAKGFRVEVRDSKGKVLPTTFFITSQA